MKQQRHMAHHAGFNLVELSIVMLIIGLMLASIIPYMAAEQSQRRINQDREILKMTKQFLLDFATVNGRLPCPATHPSQGMPDSLGEANPIPVGTVNCMTQLGFLPARTLGIPNTFGETGSPAFGLLPNAYQTERAEYTIRYALTNLSLPGNLKIPPASANLSHALANLSTANLALNGMGVAGIQNALNSDSLLDGRGLSICKGLAPYTTVGCGTNDDVLVTDVVALVFSSGANSSGGSGQENANTDNTHRVYIWPSERRRDDPANPFDDWFETITLGELVSALAKGGWSF
jgi:prepilin-type N-terminal cleavage/methylation domain-containing protein